MWEKVKIKDVADQIRGVSYKPKDVLERGDNNVIALLRANNITLRGIGNLSDVVYVNPKCVNSKQLLLNGDILICASSGSKNLVGKAVGFFEAEPYTFGAFCKVIRPKDNINRKYLNFYFQSSKYRSVISQLSSGANINNIRNEHIDNLEIPLPPLPVQQRIADMLDKADALRRKDQELLKKYDELAQAIFIDMFGDPVKNEKGWEVGTIRDLVSEVKYGTSSPSEDNGKYPYLRMNNISYEGHWDFKKLKYINASEKDYEKYGLLYNDLVFNRTNSKELVGKTAVYKSTEKAIIAGYLIRVRVNSKGNPDYISGYLNSQHGKLTLANMCKNIVGQANINAQELQGIKILLPPLQLQEAFAKKIELINQLKAKVSAEKSEELFQSLLQSTFKE